MGYVVAVIGVGEVLRRLAGRGGEFTRKLVHIFIGLWIIPTIFLFRHWYWAIVPPALATINNSLSLRRNFMKSIEKRERLDYGTVLFPASFIVCLAAFFPTAHPEAAAAGIVVMALGDAAAGAFGRKFGRHVYTFLGAKKSFEGSAAMFVVSFIAVFATLAVFKVPAQAAALTALVLSAVGTVVEAAGKHGLDNLTVPVVCSTLAFVMLRAFSGGTP